MSFSACVIGAVNQCQSERVNILLKNEIWKASLLNSKSDESKALESNLASAVSYHVILQTSGHFPRYFIHEKNKSRIQHTINATFSKWFALITFIHFLIPLLLPLYHHHHHHFLLLLLLLLLLSLIKKELSEKKKPLKASLSVLPVFYKKLNLN